MRDPVYIHIDYQLHPHLRIEGCPLAGEGFWCQPNGDGTYVVDNLLNTTMEVGYRDTIRCMDQGTSWGAREFYEVVREASCYRFLVAAPEHIDEQHHGQFVQDLYRRVLSNWPEAAAEGGMGLLAIQASLLDGPNVLRWLDTLEYPFMCVATHTEEEAANLASQSLDVLDTLLADDPEWQAAREQGS